MTLDTYAKRKIRTALLLELNTCFTNITRYYLINGSEPERAYIQTLIAAIRELVDGNERDADLGRSSS